MESHRKKVLIVGSGMMVPAMLEQLVSKHDVTIGSNILADA
jgi:hypothetical protein